MTLNSHSTNENAMRHEAAPLRVLQIVDTLGMGGAETWLVALQEHWSKSGHVQVDYLLTSGNRGIFDDTVARLGARLFYCRYQRSRLPGFAREFRKILRDGQYDAIHDHQDYASGWHFLIGLGRLPKVVIAHVHNPTNHITANYGVSPLRRLTAGVGRFALQHLATNVCGTSAEILRGYGFEVGRKQRPPVSVAHCGFKVARFGGPRDQMRQEVLKEFGWTSDSKLVLFAGRLDRSMEFDHPQNHKNSWFALNVARQAAIQDDKICLIMAGAGDEMRVRLEDTVASWGLSDRLKLVGVRHDLQRLMPSADVLLFPSRQEGLGMVAVEAQAAGLPVLASTGVPQECVVVPELCHFLSLQSPIEHWTETLVRLANQPRLPIAHCQTAVQASDFSIENSAAKLESVYSQIRHSA